MKRGCTCVVALVVGVGALGLGAASHCRAAVLAEPPAAQPAQLTDKAWLYEIVRHLYRWYIDEKNVDSVVASNEVVFWVRELKPTLDEGDRSKFGEVILPQFGLVVRVKQADYTIPELKAVVKNSSFRITKVSRITALPPVKPEGSVEIKVNYTELRDELFRTRALAAFPQGDLLERLRAAVRAEVGKAAPEKLVAKPGEPVQKQVVFLAPLSPVANETWVFWETGRSLIRFASDIDLSNPSVWEHETLAVRMYPLDQKVVVSLDEVSGSNAFMTRDEAGRALFNCVVLGRRVELEPPANAAPGEKAK